MKVSLDIRKEEGQKRRGVKGKKRKGERMNEKPSFVQVPWEESFLQKEEFEVISQVPSMFKGSLNPSQEPLRILT